MSLIKCPECNKEISDKAKTCPNCGCPIKKTMKTKENNVNRRMSHSIQIGRKALAIIVFIGVFIICFFALKKENIFKEYTDYIGQSYEKLPNDYEIYQVLNGLWVAERDLNVGDEKFALIDGTISYSYFDEKSDAYNTKANEIFALVWRSDHDSILSIEEEETKKATEELKKLLEETYGKFDEELEFDNTSEMFGYKSDSFLCKRYLWNNKKGLDIFLDIESEDDDEMGNMCTSVSVTWRKYTK